MSYLTGLISRRDQASDERNKVQQRINYYRALYKQIDDNKLKVDDSHNGLKALANNCINFIKMSYRGKSYNDIKDCYEPIQLLCSKLSSDFSYHRGEVGKRIRNLEDRKDELTKEINSLQDEIDEIEEEEEDEW